MAARNTQLRYGSVAMTLHWLIAVFVIANICLGLYMSELSRDDPSKFLIVQTHKSIGLTVLLLSLARLGWRLVNPVPPLPAQMNAFLRFTARGTQVFLYFLIIAIPLTGWAAVSSSTLGTPTMYFGLFHWPHIPWLADLARADKKPFHDVFNTTHALLAWSAIVLVPLHVAGALYHQFIRRDDVLKRMLPGTKLKEAQ
jgi:cytochrome b561